VSTWGVVGYNLVKFFGDVVYRCGNLGYYRSNRGMHLMSFYISIYIYPGLYSPDIGVSFWDPISALLAVIKAFTVFFSILQLGFF